MTTKPPPTPWKINDGFECVDDADGNLIVYQRYLGDEAIALLVRAVNAHDDLVATLKAIADPTVRIDGVFAQFAIERFQSLAHGALSQIEEAK